MATGLQMPQDTLFGIGVQTGSGADDYAKMSDGFENPELSDIYYFPLTDGNLGIQKGQQSLPPEMGGKAMSFGSFVTGVWGAGAVTLIPRLSNRLGWLLLAVMGECSTETDVKAGDLGILGGSDATTNGVNSHIFMFSGEDEFFAPWVTMVRKLPHSSADEEVGERMQDGRLATMTLNVGSGAPVTMDLETVARRLQASEEFDVNPGWSATFDSLEDFAVSSCAGHFKVEDTTLDVTAVSVTVNNDILPPQQSITVGSVDPKDFPILGRTVQVTATVLVDNYDFYLQTFTDDATVDVDSGTDQTASCTVYKGDLDVMVASQTAIGASGDASEKYKLRIASNPDKDNVAWQVNPIRTQPGRPVVLNVTGTVEATTSGRALYMILQNAHSDYSFV